MKSLRHHEIGKFPMSNLCECNQGHWSIQNIYVQYFKFWLIVICTNIHTIKNVYVYQGCAAAKNPVVWGEKLAEEQEERLFGWILKDNLLQDSVRRARDENLSQQLNWSVTNLHGKPLAFALSDYTSKFLVLYNSCLHTRTSTLEEVLNIRQVCRWVEVRGFITGVALAALAGILRLLIIRHRQRVSRIMLTL